MNLLATFVIEIAKCMSLQQQTNIITSIHATAKDNPP